MSPGQGNLTRNDFLKYGALVVAILIHVFYYVSALNTHTLDYFFAWGNVHDAQGIDFYQVPNGAYAYLHGGSLTGQMPTSAPTYSFGNINVYHPFFTIVVGSVFLLFSPQVSFFLWAMVKLLLTIIIGVYIFRRFRDNHNLIFALCVFLILFPQYLEIWNGQYHFLLNIALFFLVLALVQRRDYLAGVLYFLTLTVKPIGLLWIVPFLFKRQWRALTVGLALFAVATIPFVLNNAGMYYISNLINRVNNPIGSPPGNFTLDALLRFFGLPLVDTLIKVAVVLALLVIEIRLRPHIFISLFLWISYYLLFYDLVYEYHYTVLIPIFVLGVLTQSLFQTRLAKILIAISCLPTPFFLMHFFQIGATGHYVTNAGWVVMVLWRIIPLIALDVAIVVGMVQGEVRRRRFTPFMALRPPFWPQPAVTTNPAVLLPPRLHSSTRPHVDDRPRGWWLRALRAQPSAETRSEGTATTPSAQLHEMEQPRAEPRAEPRTEPSAPQRPRLPQQGPRFQLRQPRTPPPRWPRGLIAAAVVIIVVIIAASITNSAQQTTSSTSTPTVAPTPVPSTVASSLSLNAAVLSSCHAPTALRHGSGARRAKVALDTLPVICGRVSLTTAHHAAWHHLTFTRGLQFNGQNTGAVFVLGGRYRKVAGTVYVDNATGTTGGIFDLYAATSPGNVSTYQTLYEGNTGPAPQNKLSFSVPVSGVRYLALVERCCTAQNTVLDVVASLTKAHAGL